MGPRAGVVLPVLETPDQAAAIAAVKKDLESSQPMDRLVVGDVGFGKTEVALRAAFRAVNDGRQVAVLVPTTVLALQHFTTFQQRLAAFPVRVEMLSPAQQSRAAGGDSGSRRRERRHRDRHAPSGPERRPVQESGPGRHRRGAALRRSPERVPQEATNRGRRAHHERDSDSPHPAHGACRHPRHQHDRHRAAGAAANPDVRHPHAGSADS